MWVVLCVFFFKQKTAYEMRISDWSSDVCSSDLWSATELLHGYATRAVSPVDATRAALARIDALNGRLNAFRLVDAEGALAVARESEARWAKGAPQGLVDGVPTSIKDLSPTRGWSTLCGSRTVEIGSASCRERVCQEG